MTGSHEVRSSIPLGFTTYVTAEPAGSAVFLVFPFLRLKYQKCV